MIRRKQPTISHQMIACRECGALRYILVEMCFCGCTGWRWAA